MVKCKKIHSFEKICFIFEGKSLKMGTFLQKLLLEMGMGFPLPAADPSQTKSEFILTLNMRLASSSVP